MTRPPNRHDIKVITFDLDDTLWPTRPVLERAERETYAWLGENAPKITQRFKPKDLVLFATKLKRNNPALAHRISDMRRAYYRELSLACGYSEVQARAIAEQAFTVFIKWRQQVEYFAGVEETLANLAKHYLLGALTNGNANLEVISVGRFFDFSISAESLNASKPDPIIFTSALAQARAKSSNAIQPEHIAHVGDNLNTDIRGAKSAGFYSIWLPPPQSKQQRAEKDLPGKQVSDAGQPDLTLHSISQLPQAIATLRQ